MDTNPTPGTPVPDPGQVPQGDQGGVTQDTPQAPGADTGMGGGVQTPPAPTPEPVAPVAEPEPAVPGSTPEPEQNPAPETPAPTGGM